MKMYLVSLDGQGLVCYPNKQQTQPYIQKLKHKGIVNITEGAFIPLEKEKASQIFYIAVRPDGLIAKMPLCDSEETAIKLLEMAFCQNYSDSSWTWDKIQELGYTIRKVVLSFLDIQ